MNIEIAGTNIELGSALQTRIETDLEAAVTKYFERGATSGHVGVKREGHLFHVDCLIHLPSGINLQATGEHEDVHAAFDRALEKIEKRVRRYKRRLKDHHKSAKPLPEEIASAFVLADNSDEDDDIGTDDAPIVIAETKAKVRTMTVSMAVMQLGLGEQPALMFRNAATNELNTVYRREDGHIGWIDPGHAA